MLFSYVIKRPDYLITEAAVEIVNKEKEDIRIKEERDLLKSSPYKSTRIQEKLVKLKELKDLNLISEKEYEQKKAQLLENF